MILGRLSLRRDSDEGDYVDMHYRAPLARMSGWNLRGGKGHVITRYGVGVDAPILPTYTVTWFIEAVIIEAALNDRWLIEKCVVE